MCCPAIRFALSVAEVRVLCCDRVTEETLGSQMSVTRRVKDAACWAPNWCLDEESQGGAARNFVVLVVE